ncbi:MAG: laccase [Micrococcales bacterium]|nr:MAG: laccase [Micrococcales bacterium]PIE27333.1 MAG: laccase [Micrococcales bacterium]
MTSRGNDVADPLGTFNLATHVADDEGAVRQRRAEAATVLGIAPDHLLFLDQVHGNTVVQATDPWDSPPQADAAVTATPGIHLAVLVADCVPVLLADDEHGIAGVAHAGRRGVESGVVTACVAAMRDLGARQLHALIGPGICGSCYEVPGQVRADVTRQVPATFARTRAGTPSLDLPAGVRTQLADLGVAAQHIGTCTMEDPQWYSHRRQHGRAGRFAGIAGVLARDRRA